MEDVVNDGGQNEHQMLVLEENRIAASILANRALLALHLVFELVATEEMLEIVAAQAEFEAAPGDFADQHLTAGQQRIDDVQVPVDLFLAFHLPTVLGTSSSWKYCKSGSRN